MSSERLYLYDTTLRDGAQTTGVDFSLEDKRTIAGLLDRIGIDYIEGGYPGANPLDTEFFAEKPLIRAKFCAFGMTKRAGAPRPTIRASRRCSTPTRMQSASSPRRGIIMSTLRLSARIEESLAGIRESIVAARDKGREVLLDCEHFFDGYKANREYALACAKAAYESGARWVVLCDTNGGTMPHEIAAIVARGRKGGAGRHVSASMRMTIAAARWPIRWRRSRLECGTFRERSMGLASAAATPIS